MIMVIAIARGICSKVCTSRVSISFQHSSGHSTCGQPRFASLHELLNSGVVVGRIDPLPATQVVDGRFPAEPF